MNIIFDIVSQICKKCNKLHKSDSMSVKIFFELLCNLDMDSKKRIQQ